MLSREDIDKVHYGVFAFQRDTDAPLADKAKQVVDAAREGGWLDDLSAMTGAIDSLLND